MKTYMQTKKHKSYFCILLLLAFFVCVPSLISVSKAHAITNEELETALVKLLEKKPEILFNVMANNSIEFIDTITKASENARTQKLHQQWDTDLKTPKNLELINRPIHGNVTAKQTIVGYSDFLCSYCAQAAQTIEALLKKRKDVKFIFKGIPTNDASRTAMKWFYLLYEKDSKKAWQFHDSIFANQKAFSQNHMPVIHELAKRLNYNPAELERELKERDKELNARIDTDIKELAKLELTGTPNFIINDLVLKGAYPLNVLEDAISYSEKK